MLRIPAESRICGVLGAGLQRVIRLLLCLLLRAQFLATLSGRIRLVFHGAFAHFREQLIDVAVALKVPQEEGVVPHVGVEV